MSAVPTLAAAYRGETEQLMAEQIPQVCKVFLLLMGLAGLTDLAFFPHRFPLFVGFYAAEALVCVSLTVCRNHLAQRRLLTPATILAALLLAALVNGFSTVGGIDPPVAGLAAVCLSLGLCLLLPWGARGQMIVALGILATYAFFLLTSAPSPTPRLYLFPLVGVGMALSIFGARNFDLYRFAIFREATLGEEEAEINRMLVTIAKDINAGLDERDVLDHIALSTRSALQFDWSLVLLWDDSSRLFRVAGHAGSHSDSLRELRNVDLGPGVFPLLDRVLQEGYVELGEGEAHDPATEHFLRRWRSRHVLATTLTRSGHVVGVLLAGTPSYATGLSDHVRRLFRGIAQHAAIAVNNFRLVDDLRQADRLKSEFVATMSHELRTPLNVILGYTDLLLDGGFGSLDGEQSGVLARLRMSASSLLELINATLEVNRLEAGRSPARPTDVDLANFARAVRTEVEDLPRSPGVEVRWQVSGAPYPVRVDPGKLKIILKNLLGNAFKYTDTGEVRVEIAYERAAARLRIEVADTGAGIQPQDLPHIFEMFRQAPHGRRLASGVGLGLYIVKRFAEQLRGEVEAESKPGKGSSFRVLIPAPAVQADEVREEAGMESALLSEAS